IPPSLNFERPNPNADWENSPFYVSTELSPWEPNGKEVRRAGASAFGFGGTNFHAVLEEYIPGRIQTERRAHTATKMPVATTRLEVAPKAPLRGALVVGGATQADVRDRLAEIHDRALAGDAPPAAPPAEADLRAEVRVAIDYGDAAELAAKTEKALKALAAGQPAMWKALANQGVFLGRGEAPLVAFLYTGQGSQYVNMMRDLRDVEPIVDRVFQQADEVMTPLLDGRSLTSYIFVGSDDLQGV
ncbi:MAG: hypothetical protein GY778_20425, partial [bacterium]|nr:hypothetical protein [bacterium]